MNRDEKESTQDTTNKTHGVQQKWVKINKENSILYSTSLMRSTDNIPLQAAYFNKGEYIRGK